MPRDLRLLDLDEFVDLLRSRGDRVFTLDDGATSVELPPLQLAASHHQLAAQPDDLGFLAVEQAAAIRHVPHALFEAREVDLIHPGVPSVDSCVCGRTIRTHKFFAAAKGQPPAQARGAHSIGKLALPPPLLIGPLETFNYSHWVIEGLPKIELYRRAYTSLPSELVVCGGPRPFHTASAQYAVPGSTVRTVRSFPTTVPHLAFTTSLARSVREVSPTVFAYYQQLLADRFAGRQPSGTRLYISRQNASHRRVLNEDALLNMLAGHGFMSVLPEQLSFEQQVELFWNAEVVVGAHGAGMANLVFAEHCKLAVELFSSGFSDASAYAHICRQKGILYLAVSGPPGNIASRGPSDPEGWPGHKSFTVPVEHLADAIGSAIEVAARSSKLRRR